MDFQKNLALSEDIDMFQNLFRIQMEDIMSKICQICGKKAGSGRNVSHAKNRTLRKFNPNLQKVRVDVDGKPVKMTVCSRCIKADKVKKYVK